MKSVCLGELQAAFVDEGQGTPIVFLHGFPLDHSMWEGQIHGLASKFRVIAPDMRGFGRSEASPGVATMEQMADDALALLDALGICRPVVVCGLSMGGYAAFQFWHKHAARVHALILCDTRAGADSPDAAAGRRKTAERIETEGPAFLADAMEPRLFSPTSQKISVGRIERMRQVIANGSPIGVAAAARGMAVRPDMTERLREIRCPVLAVVGEDDLISPPEEMRRMAESIPNSRLATIPRAGHMAPLEQPEAVNAEIERFLDSIAGPADAAS